MTVWHRLNIANCYVKCFLNPVVANYAHHKHNQLKKNVFDHFMTMNSFGINKLTATRNILLTLCTCGVVDVVIYYCRDIRHVYCISYIMSTKHVLVSSNCSSAKYRPSKVDELMRFSVFILPRHHLWFAEISSVTRKTRFW